MIQTETLRVGENEGREGEAHSFLKETFHIRTLQFVTSAETERRQRERGCARQSARCGPRTGGGLCVNGKFGCRWGARGPSV